MQCRRAERVELEAFLLGRDGDAETEAFRAHYASCGDCAAAVAEWMVLEEAVRHVAGESGVLASGHPEPEDLAQFAEGAARMGARAAQIETHLAGCARCASEFRLIRSFDPTLFAAAPEAMPAAARIAAPVRGAEQARGLGGLRAAVASWVEWLRGLDGLSPMPVLALAVVVLVGLWLSGSLERWGGTESEREQPQLVDQPSPRAEALKPVPSLEPSEAAPEALAQASPDAEAAPHTAAPDATVPPVLEVEPEPQALAQAEPPATSSSAPEAAPEPALEPAPEEAERGREEILLASLDTLPAPDYAMPGGSDSAEWMRQFGAVRSAPGDARVFARAPGNHTGLTLSRKPRLWWALDAATDRPIQLTIVDDAAIDPIARVELAGPHAAGLHAFDLDRQGFELVPGVDYRWFVSIVVDPDRPSRNPISAGSLRVVGESDARRAKASGADPSTRGNQLAELGLWYDAYDFYASLAAAHPEVERLAAHRDRLVEAASASR